MGMNPDITVAAIVEEDGRFLVVEERINNRLVFNQPAGHVENGETLIEAVAREAREETAWKFTPHALLGVYLWCNPRTGRSTKRFAFSGRVTDHNAAQPLDRGIVRTHWFSRKDMLDHERRLRSPLVLRCVDDYLGGRALPLRSVATVDLQSALDIEAVTV
jgi:8-oxo-dGTP pyrophosphatase MutT (NUDIX family)